MLVAKKISPKDAEMYVVFQIIGVILGSIVLYVLAQNSGSTTTLTANGYTDVLPALIAEIVFTFIFVLVVFGVTSKGAPNEFVGLAIGLTLVFVFQLPELR